MPGGFPLMGLDLCNGNSIGTVQASTVGTTIAPSTSANTKGSWTQLVASAGSDISRLFLYAAGFNVVTGGETFAIDIGIGASGSEVVLVPNVIFCMQNEFAFLIMTLDFPISIPAGTRISARCAVNTASGDSIGLSLVGYDAGFTGMEGATGVDAIGFTAASTQGTAVTSGSSAKGSYSQIIAKTARDYAGLFAIADVSGVGSPGSSQLYVDISIGVSGSEKVIIPDAFINVYSGFTVILFTPVAISSGARLAARANGGGEIINLTLYGVYL